MIQQAHESGEQREGEEQAGEWGGSDGDEDRRESLVSKPKKTPTRVPVSHRPVPKLQLPPGHRRRHRAPPPLIPPTIPEASSTEERDSRGESDEKEPAPRTTQEIKAILKPFLKAYVHTTMFVYADQRSTS